MIKGSWYNLHVSTSGLPPIVMCPPRWPTPLNSNFIDATPIIKGSINPTASRRLNGLNRRTEPLN